MNLQSFFAKFNRNFKIQKHFHRDSCGSFKYLQTTSNSFHSLYLDNMLYFCVVFCCIGSVWTTSKPSKTTKTLQKGLSKIKVRFY